MTEKEYRSAVKKGAELALCFDVAHRCISKNYTQEQIKDAFDEVRRKTTYISEMVIWEGES